MTYEDFTKMFEGLSPEETMEQISKFQKYLDAVNKSFHEKYTYCTGCKKLVSKANSSQHFLENKILIRCDACHTVWYIKDIQCENF